MNSAVRKMARPEPYRSILFLGSLIVLRAIGQILLYSKGFLNVSADEFARGIVAARWALQPRFDLFDGPPGAWLPLEKYVNGLPLTVWPDAVLSPRVTVFLSSSLALIGLYVLVHYLFGSFSIAALASTFVVVQPWYVWLSGTPMLEMYYLAFYLLGMYLLLAWLKDNRRSYWFLSGLTFAIASGFHVQSWYLINLLNLLTFGFLIQFARRRQFGRFDRLLGYYFLSNALIITFLAIEYYYSGEVLGFLARHTSYSGWYYGGYDVDLLEKLLYYPRLVLKNSSPIIWPLVIVGLLFLKSDQDRVWKLFPLLLALLTLVFSSVSNVFSVPATAAPSRYSLFYTLMLSPYIAYGTYQLFQWAKRRPRQLARYLAAAVAIVLFSYTLLWGVIRAYDHPNGHQDAVQAGRYLNELLSQAGLAETQTYMVELEYWDFLALTLAAGHYNQTVYDREQDIRNRQIPSMFEEDPALFYDVLVERNVRYVALHDPALKARVQKTGFLSAQGSVDGWTIYEFAPGS